jgi:hypothetical protein
MKTNMNPVFFLYRNQDGKMNKSFECKDSYDTKITMISHQLLYESTANDIFWVFRSKRHPETVRKYF